MNTTHYFVDQGLGWATGMVLVTLFLGLSKRRWIRQAHKLAAQSDIALPSLLADRVARLLRNEYLFAMVLMIPFLPLLDLIVDGTQTGGRWAARFPSVLIGLPLFCAIVFFLMTLGPRWRASRDYRVAHLDRLPVRAAFTRTELAAVIAGCLITAGLGGWGLAYAKAPVTWWLACAAALAVTYAMGQYVATGLMNRPSSASDSIELGWDDLLRFRMVRSVMIGLAWAPAVFIYTVNCAMMSLFFRKFTAPGEMGFQLEWWTILTPIAVWLVLHLLVFRQGRQLWRRAWQERVA